MYFCWRLAPSPGLAVPKMLFQPISSPAESIREATVVLRAQGKRELWMPATAWLAESNVLL